MKVQKIRGVVRSKADRKKEEWARVYGSPARVEWVKSLPCCFCSRTPSENAHTQNGGIGRKAGYETIAPLCAIHHRTIHQHGATPCEMLYGVDLRECAAWTQEQWLIYQAKEDSQ